VQTWLLSSALQQHACSLWSGCFLATVFFFSPSHGPLLSSFLHSLSSQAFLWYLYFPPEPSSARTDHEFSSVTRLSPSVLASHWLTSSHVTRTGGGPDCWLTSQVPVLYGLASHTCWFVGRQTDSWLTVSGVCFQGGGCQTFYIV